MSLSNEAIELEAVNRARDIVARRIKIADLPEDERHRVAQILSDWHIARLTEMFENWKAKRGLKQ